MSGSATAAWRGWIMSCLAALVITVPQGSAAQSPAATPDARRSGNSFLSAELRRLQQDAASNPLGLWQDRGQTLWQEGTRSCQSCHGALDGMKQAVTHYPRLSADGAVLRNLEDQIVICRARSGQAGAKLEDEEVLALSVALNTAAAGLPIEVKPEPAQAAAWQARLEHGAQLYSTRTGRMNLACVNCHDQHVGAQMRADVISPGHPTGFPIYRMSWQTAGSIDRRLRACFSGVQAQLPPSGSAVLRDLELYLKVRANGMPLDGPSLRR